MPEPTVFPITVPEKVNSPELLAYLQSFGPSFYLTAEEIVLIFQALKELDLRNPGEGASDPNKLDRGGYSGTAQNIVDTIPSSTTINNKLERGGYSGTAQNLADFILSRVANSEKGVANGVATLDANGKLPASQTSATAITDTFVKASQAEMLALDVQVGDICVRTDLNKTFILKSEPASVLGNWQEMLTPTNAVQSVNGETGTVNLDASKIAPTAARKYITNDASGTALVDADMIPVIIEADGLVKYRSWMQIKSALTTLFSPLFQKKDAQISIGSAMAIPDTWDGQTIIFTANCTITVPATLPAGFGFNFIVKIGATVTWAITTPHVWAWGTPAPTSEKTYGNFTKEGSTNNIILGT